MAATKQNDRVGLEGTNESFPERDEACPLFLEGVVPPLLTITATGRLLVGGRGSGGGRGVEEVVGGGGGGVVVPRVPFGHSDRRGWWGAGRVIGSHTCATTTTPGWDEFGTVLALGGYRVTPAASWALDEGTARGCRGCSPLSGAEGDVRGSMDWTR